MTTFLLDTDVCVWLLRRHPGVRAHVEALSPDDVAVASMTEAELRFGVLAGRRPEDILRVDALIGGLRVLPFDRTAARAHAEARLALRRQPIGERDLVIASVALAHGLVMATGNRREFARVPGLAVEDWTT